MSEFLFALVAVFLTSLGGRDQMLVARLSANLGRHSGLLMTGCAVACATAAAMAWGGNYVASFLPGAGKTMLVAIGLLIAAIELCWPVKMGLIREPTRSLGAAGLVLVIRQMGDAARFVIFALAAALASPGLAGLGGALGGMLALAFGWSGALDHISEAHIRRIRIALGLCIGVIALFAGLSARGLIG